MSETDLSPAVQRPDPAEEPYERLRVFAYTVEGYASAYRAIMTVFARAKTRFRIQMRAVDVQRELDTLGWPVTLPEAGLEAALDQLTEWGNLERSHDTARVSTLADFRRRRFIYRITPAGEAAEAAVAAVVEAMHATGSLQKVMLGAITRGLGRLVAEMGRPDPDAAVVFENLFNVTSQFETLAQNATTFMASLDTIIESTRVEETAFLAYKQDVIAYLEEFIGELSRTAPRIREALVALRDTAGFDLTATIAASADKTPSLDGGPSPVDDLEAKLVGITIWFLGSELEPPTLDLLRGAARNAINRILLVLGRLHDSRFRRVDRSADLCRVAEWISSADGDDIHHVFQAAFGLFSARHLAHPVVDPTADGPRTPWREAAPAEIEIALRHHGKRASPGRAARVVDNADTKRHLARAHQELQRSRRSALDVFAGRTIPLGDLGVLDDDQLDVLLELLDRLLAAPPGPDGARRARTADGRNRLQLSGRANGHASVRTKRGRLNLPDWTLTVEPLGAPVTLGGKP